jgi:hypothetical protein
VPEVSWWASDLKPELSQGDVLAEVPGASLVFPLTYLNPRPARQPLTVYEPSLTPFSKAKKGDDRTFMLSNGEVAGAIVLSYDCEIDKAKKILIAPAFAISSLPAESQVAVLEQRRFSLMPLPEVPQLGTCYADFRLIQSTRREFLSLDHRLISMTQEAVDRLQAHLTAFFTRRAIGPTTT